MWVVCINLILSVNAIASIRTGYHSIRVLQMKMEKLTLQPISRITGQVQSYGIHPFYLTIIDIAM
jgi:3-phosphoshikimate 1-carboxyvinyltransferase